MNFRYQLILRLEKALEIQRNRTFDTSKILEIGYWQVMNDMMQSFGTVLNEKNSNLSIKHLTTETYTRISQNNLYTSYQIMKSVERSFLWFKWTAYEGSLKFIFEFYKKADAITYFTVWATHEDELKNVAILRDIQAHGHSEIFNETLQRSFLQLLDKVEKADYNIFERA